jgi:hypothetical protein
MNSKMDAYMKISDSNDGKQSIGELWESLAQLSSHIVEDNKKYDGGYPKSVREIQLHGIETLVKEINILHEKGLE